jgi:hypothetical protein
MIVAAGICALAILTLCCLSVAFALASNRRKPCFLPDQPQENNQRNSLDADLERGVEAPDERLPMYAEEGDIGIRNLQGVSVEDPPNYGVEGIGLPRHGGEGEIYVVGLAEGEGVDLGIEPPEYEQYYNPWDMGNEDGRV